MKDYTYTVIDANKVPYGSSYILRIFSSTWCGLATSGMIAQHIDWVKLILNELIYMLM